MPYVVTTRTPAARAASSRSAGAAAPPSSTDRNDASGVDISIPRSSSRRSCVGTSETCAQPLAATVSRVGPVGQHRVGPADQRAHQDT